MLVSLMKKKDYICPNPEDTTEFRFVDENMKTAWSTVNVSQHPKYYTSDIEDEKIDIGGFFNKDKFFHDNTYPDSTTTLPEDANKINLEKYFVIIMIVLQLNTSKTYRRY